MGPWLACKQQKQTLADLSYWVAHRMVRRAGGPMSAASQWETMLQPLHRAAQPPLRTPGEPQQPELTPEDHDHHLRGFSTQSATQSVVRNQQLQHRLEGVTNTHTSDLQHQPFIFHNTSRWSLRALKFENHVSSIADEALHSGSKRNASDWQILGDGCPHSRGRRAGNPVPAMSGLLCTKTYGVRISQDIEKGFKCWPTKR